MECYLRLAALARLLLAQQRTPALGVLVIADVLVKAQALRGAAARQPVPHVEEPVSKCMLSRVVAKEGGFMLQQTRGTGYKHAGPQSIGDIRVKKLK